jgi:hypothetical protein
VCLAIGLKKSGKCKAAITKGFAALGALQHRVPLSDRVGLQNMVRNPLGKSLAKFDPLFLAAQERLPGQALCKVSGQAV